MGKYKADYLIYEFAASGAEEETIPQYTMFS